MEREELHQHLRRRLLLAASACSACQSHGQPSCQGLPEEETPELAGPEAALERFHLVPHKGWDRHVRGMRCAARNTIRWKGSGCAPAAPHPCWLLPTSGVAAVAIAEQQEQLRSQGWKLLTCEPHVVQRLDNKAELRAHAERCGLLEYLPEPYESPDSAHYPCILKSATGEFGQDCHIVHSAPEALEVAKEGYGTKWVLQELVRGHFEYSTSLLVHSGRIIESIGMEYEYGSEAYVYPNVRKVGKAMCEVSAEHLAVMEAFLREYSGICNFNYKLRPDGRLCVFEVNARVGGDLAIDVPRQRARALFERLDGLASGQPAPRPAPAPADAAPFVLEPRDGVHRLTLVYLHPFRSGLEDYVRKAHFFRTDGLRLVMPRAPKMAVSCCGGRRMLSWYDYLTDSDGLAEDEPGTASLAETRARLFALLDAERAALRAAAGVPEEAAEEPRLFLGGCSQGCGAALDAALGYPVRLGGFVGVVGHPLSATQLGRHLDMPLHFFCGAKDKVMRWAWVGDRIEALRRAGYRRLAVHGPLRGVHHVVSRQEEAGWLREALGQCTGGPPLPGGAEGR